MSRLLSFSQLSTTPPCGGNTLCSPPSAGEGLGGVATVWLLGIATQTPVDVNLSEARSPFFRDDPRGGTAGLCGAAGLTGGPPCGCPPWRRRFSLARHHVRIPETPAHTCCFLFITSISAVPERAALTRTSLVANHAERPRACGHGYLSSGEHHPQPFWVSLCFSVACLLLPYMVALS